MREFYLERVTEIVKDSFLLEKDCQIEFLQNKLAQMTEQLDLKRDKIVNDLKIENQNMQAQLQKYSENLQQSENTGQSKINYLTEELSKVQRTLEESVKERIELESEYKQELQQLHIANEDLKERLNKQARIASENSDH